MKHGMQPADLGKPGADGFDKLSACFEARRQCCSHSSRWPRSEVVGAQLVEAVGGSGRRGGPEGEFLSEPVGAVGEQRLQAAGQFLEIRIGAERGFGFVVARIAVVLPDVVEGLEVADDDFQLPVSRMGRPFSASLGKYSEMSERYSSACAGENGLTLDLVDELATRDLHGVGLGGDAFGFGRLGSVEERLEEALLWLSILRGRLLLCCGALISQCGTRRDDERA